VNLTTRCPSCGTAFRVQPAQLSARGGKVRCGKCSGVFDGVKALLAEGAEPGAQLQEIESEPSPQLGLFEAPKKLSGAGDAANEDVPVPAFLEETPQPRRRVLWALARAAGTGRAAGAGDLFPCARKSRCCCRRRDRTWRPPARRSKCELRPAERPKLMAIESSEPAGRRPARQRDRAERRCLRNQAQFAQGYPSLELTLHRRTRRGGRRRRVLEPPRLSRRRGRPDVRRAGIGRGQPTRCCALHRHRRGCALSATACISSSIMTRECTH
jgi:predicted Zn finger-like uncharacterized protein